MFLLQNNLTLLDNCFP